MAQPKKSKLLGTTAAAFLALATAGCASAVDFDRWDLKPEATARADMAGIQPILRVAHATKARGDLATAVGLYRRAHELAPNLPEPLFHLGFTLNQAGATTQAAEAFRRALVLDPDNPEALRGLGLAYLNRNQIELALNQFYRALDVEEDVRLYNAIGVAYDMMGDHHGAHTHYYLGLEVDPQNVSLRTNLGLSLALAGYSGDAVRLMDSVARDPRATPQHRQTLAMAYGLAGDMSSAAKTAAMDMDDAAVQEHLRYYQALRTRRKRQTAAFK